MGCFYTHTIDGNMSVHMIFSLMSHVLMIRSLEKRLLRNLQQIVIAVTSVLSLYVQHVDFNHTSFPRSWAGCCRKNDYLVQIEAR